MTVYALCLGFFLGCLVGAAAAGLAAVWLLEPPRPQEHDILTCQEPSCVLGRAGMSE